MRFFSLKILPISLGGLEGGWCIGVPAKRRQKRFAHSTASRKEKKSGAWLPGVRRAVRSQVPGERGKLGEVGEWQCEVRWGARRVVARREHREPESVASPKRSPGPGSPGGSQHRQLTLGRCAPGISGTHVRPPSPCFSSALRHRHKAAPSPLGSGRAFFAIGAGIRNRRTFPTNLTAFRSRPGTGWRRREPNGSGRPSNALQGGGA